MAIKTQTVSAPDRFGYLAQPESAARAGVLILPTIFRVNEFARSYADTLANNGLAAAVWDINSGLPLTTDYQECLKRARTLTDGAWPPCWTDGSASSGRRARLHGRKAPDVNPKATALAAPQLLAFLQACLN